MSFNKRFAYILMMAFALLVIAVIYRTSYPYKPHDIIVIADVGFGMDEDVEASRNEVPNDYTRLRLRIATSITLAQLVPLTRTGSQLRLVTYSRRGDPLLRSDNVLPETLTEGVFVHDGPGSNVRTVSNGLMAACYLFDATSRPGVPSDIVLFTDSGNQHDDAVLAKAISDCRQRNIKVVIVGLGNRSLGSTVPFTTEDNVFQTNLARRLNGKYIPIYSEADLNNLRLLP